MGNLTDALRWFAPKAHTDSTDSTDSTSIDKSANLFNPLNLCEICFNNSVSGICVRRGEAWWGD